ncbi:hypothetical protein ACG9Y4_14850 [Acinetobacter guillouiae]|uniref:hypothetical protein n=1 Tax=Acinetobacter guillouiae TaxID=106649 RepID=UPI003AF8DA78
MNRSILAQDLESSNDDQWWIDHEAYSDALEEYKKVETELEDALGVIRICEPGELTSLADSCEELRINMYKFGLIHRFESAYRKMFEAKAKL